MHLKPNYVRKVLPKFHCFLTEQTPQYNDPPPKKYDPCKVKKFMEEQKQNRRMKMLMEKRKSKEEQEKRKMMLEKLDQRQKEQRKKQIAAKGWVFNEYI